jgi:hypothetical protein
MHPRLLRLLRTRKSLHLLRELQYLLVRQRTWHPPAALQVASPLHRQSWRCSRSWSLSLCPITLPLPQRVRPGSPSLLIMVSSGPRSSLPLPGMDALLQIRFHKEQG